MRRWVPLAVLLLFGCTTPSPVDTRRSGFEDMGASTQSMQRDDAENPGMLWVQDGEQLWARTCASCHGDAKSMRGVAARYPAWDEPLRRPVDLATRINLCRERHQQLKPLPPEHHDLLALEAFVAMQSRGMPIRPANDERLQPFAARGEAIFRQRMGQLDLSCAQCHDERAGHHLGAALIPQGQATGYPIYRLEWQSMGSLQRRLRGCMSGVRAEPFAWSSVEMTELELYLARRAMGMRWEAPAVRP